METKQTSAGPTPELDIGEIRATLNELYENISAPAGATESGAAATGETNPSGPAMAPVPSDHSSRPMTSPPTIRMYEIPGGPQANAHALRR